VGTADGAATEKYGASGVRARLVAHQVQAVAGIELLAVDRRRYQTMPERQDRGDRIKRARGSVAVADHRAWHAHRKIDIAAECRADRFHLAFVGTTDPAP